MTKGLAFSHSLFDCLMSWPGKCPEHARYRGRGHPQANCTQCHAMFAWVRKWGKRVKGRWQVRA